MSITIDRPEIVTPYMRLSRGIDQVISDLGSKRRLSNLWGWRIKREFELLRLIPNPDYPTWLAGIPSKISHSEAEALLKQVASDRGMDYVGQVKEIPTGGFIELCPPTRGVNLLRVHHDDPSIKNLRTDWYVASENKAFELFDYYGKPFDRPL
jgi:hypothetical protein